jgi:hypothetical protein
MPASRMALEPNSSSSVGIGLVVQYVDGTVSDLQKADVAGDDAWAVARAQGRGRARAGAAVGAVPPAVILSWAWALN